MSNYQQGQKSTREANLSGQLAFVFTRDSISIISLGNAWTSSDRFGKDGALPNVLQEQHVPVYGFNAQETRGMLKKGLKSPILSRLSV